MISRVIPERLVILSALFAAAFLALSFNTASAIVTATYQAGDGSPLQYFDEHYNEVTDPTQIAAYQYTRSTNPNANLSEVLDLLQSGDLKVNEILPCTPQNEYDTSCNQPQIVPVTLTGGLVAYPGGFDPGITGVDPNSESAKLTLAAWNMGVSPSDVNTNPLTKDLPANVRQEMMQSMQRVQAFQASQDDGGFFGGFFDFIGDIVSSVVDLAVCIEQDVTHAVGLRENGCGGGGGDGGGQTAPPAQPAECRSGTTGAYPNCIPVEEGQPCSYNGNVSWDSGCSGSYSDTVQSGEVVTVQNTASGYTGSASFTCSDGNWVGGSSSCSPVSLRSCSYNGSISWGSGCSGSYSGTVQSGGLVTVTNDASCRNGSATFTCSDGNWVAAGTPTCQASILPLSCLFGTATWGAWGSCSGDCGGGKGTQTRSCSTGNSSDCSGSSSQVCTNNTACTNGNNGNNDNGSNDAGGTGTGGTGTQTTGQTTQSCTPDTFCDGSNVVSRDSSCNTSTVESCDYGCSGGQCDLPQISFSSFSAANTVTGPFTATGHLQARPSLVRRNDSTWLYWSVNNASSCSVTGSNGDSWSGKSSGPAGRISRAITGQTTYTLRCAALPGATPSSITESQVVNIAPFFQEK